MDVTRQWTNESVPTQIPQHNVNAIDYDWLIAQEMISMQRLAFSLYLTIRVSLIKNFDYRPIGIKFSCFGGHIVHYAVVRIVAIVAFVEYILV